MKNCEKMPVAKSIKLATEKTYGDSDAHEKLLKQSKIKEYLNTHNVDFEPQHTFKDCKDIQVLQFDFYLSNYNACIEYDGRQHFMPIDYFGGQQGFESTQRRDAIKTNYCTTNNIPLLRIRYDEDISSALDNFLDSLTV